MQGGSRPLRSPGADSRFCLNSGEAFVGVVGQQIEVPALIGLVNVVFWMRRRYFNAESGKFDVHPVEGAPYRGRADEEQLGYLCVLIAGATQEDRRSRRIAVYPD